MNLFKKSVPQPPEERWLRYQQEVENVAKMCGHSDIMSWSPLSTIRNHVKHLESQLAALRETRQKDYEASVAALKATGLYGEHDNDSLSVLGAFDALQLRLTALRKENARLILDSDKQIHAAEDRALRYANARDQLLAALDEQLAIFNRSRTQWKKGYDALKVDLDAAVKLLRELQLPLMPFALLDKIEKFLKELEER